MNYRLLPRHEPRPGFGLMVSIASMVMGIVIIGIVFALVGANPFYALAKIFGGSFGSPYSLGETLTKAIPLLLVAAGLCLPFAGKFWNIGAESQLLMGALAACASGLTFLRELPPPLAISIMILFGFLAGAIWGIIPAVLKIKLGINEVISTLMLNYIAAEFVSFLIIGPLRGKGQLGQAVTDNLPAAFTLLTIPGTRIHVVTLILGLAATVLVFFILKHSKLGYEIRVIGENREAARYAGIDFLKVSLVMMAISGGLAGLAGVGELLGIHGKLSSPPLTLSAGYGFTAIIVAWLARLNPWGVIFSSFFFAGILVGGDAIQISLKLPVATVSVMNGILLLCLIAGEFFLQYRIVRKVA